MTALHNSEPIPLQVVFVLNSLRTFQDIIPRVKIDVLDNLSIVLQRLVLRHNLL